MSLRQRRIFGWTMLLALAALGAAWLLRLDYSRKISTDVLDLIPPGERDPALAVVRELASEAEARTMLLVLTEANGASAPVDAARRFATELKRAPVFAQAIALGDPTWRDAVGRALFELRFTLLFPGWLREQEAAAPGDPERLAENAAARLKVFLETPEALAFQDLVPADPLLLMPGAVEKLKGGLTLTQPAGAGGAGGLVWAQLAVSPLGEAGQGPAFAVIEQAVAATRTEFAGVQVAYTGVNRFAAASRARIEKEVSWLNTASILAVLAVAWVFIRGVHRALHLLPVVAFSVLGAWVATTLAFERVHVIVFVLGALLTGVAIDYGFYLYMQPPAYPEEDYWQKVRRLLKPLLASCLTTVTGFALLLFSELPMIRQLGVFVGAGLLCALGAAILYFSTVGEAFLPPREFRVGALTPVVRRRLRLALIACWVVALPGLARLTWRDDIRELEVPAKAVREDDARIRAAFGQQSGQSVYLTHGATRDEARENLRAFEAWLGAGDGTGAKSTVTFGNLGPIVPTVAEHARAVAFLRGEGATIFASRLRTALDAQGFEVAAFEPFFTAYGELTTRAQSGELDAAVERLERELPGPLGLLLHTGSEKNWFVTLADGPAREAPPELHTVSASQLQSLNRLFANYRQSALHLSLAGLALVGLGVFFTYGLRDGVRIFAIPCGACLGLFGLFGWLGQPLNLFHLLGAFLGVCLTHNYSIFSATSAYRHEPPPVSVRVSAFTAAASFGVLALSGIPVVQALGVTVTAMVLLALLVIELEHLSPLAKAP